MPITVYGASDDLIEVDGDISAEFPSRNAEGSLLAFSDGTVLRIHFMPAGIWRIHPVVNGSGGLTIEQAPENDDSNYSDRAIAVPARPTN